MNTTSFLIGGFAGAAVAALLAPRRGTETRQALGRAMGRQAEEKHQRSGTAVAADALRTGTLPGNGAAEEARIPQEDELLRMGDPDVDPLNVAYVGDEVVGGDMPSPDNDGIDDVGRAYGVSEMDDGELQSSAEILSKRDRRR